jgi:hypothetical protein
MITAVESTSNEIINKHELLTRNIINNVCNFHTIRDKKVR